jgi:hypothetical protein
MNSLVGFVGSVFNDGLQKLDDDDIDQVITVGCCSSKIVSMAFSKFIHFFK